MGCTSEGLKREKSGLGAEFGEKPKVTQPLKPLSPKDFVMKLMEEICLASDIVASTTHGSRDNPVAKFSRNVAKMTALDEAGSMGIAEACIPWIDGRPVVMTGDPRQLAPTVMTSLWRIDGKYANMFGQMAKFSILEQLQLVGWPCLVLTRQRRMVVGGFDLVHDLFYQDVANFSYDQDLCAISKHPIAIMMEHWIGKFNLNPNFDKFWPVFFHCEDTSCHVNGFGLSFNPDQAAHAGKLISDAISSRMTTAKNFVVIVPYSAMKKYIQETWKSDTILSTIPISTTDSFQGSEGNITVFIMTRTRTPGFLKDAQRQCVAFSRHRDALWVVGDKDVCGYLDAPYESVKPKVKDTEYDEGGAEVVYMSKTLRLALEWFRDHGRIVHLTPKEIEC
ncbi:AAA domain-containing protein [Daldinia loculata]|nr:AAA domain-containing protein [Daldinia loculata]